MDLSDLIKLEEAALLANVAPRTVYRIMETKGFPRPVKFRAASFWRESEVLAWVAENRKRKPSKNPTRQHEHEEATA